ncbi:MAG TPA: transglycosylase domain-containing protein [Acidimicrobiales bacterium]|nr:transglycosylase domain-containing protein [Acidimicrobiales bacterium]
MSSLLEDRLPRLRAHGPALAAASEALVGAMAAAAGLVALPVLAVVATAGVTLAAATWAALALLGLALSALALAGHALARWGVPAVVGATRTAGRRWVVPALAASVRFGARAGRWAAVEAAWPAAAVAGRSLRRGLSWAAAEAAWVALAVAALVRQGGRRLALVGAGPAGGSLPALVPSERRARLPVIRVRAPALVTVCLASAGLVATGGPWAFHIFQTAASATSAPLRLPVLSQGSTIYDAGGSATAVLHADDNRQPVALDRIAPVLVDAVIDTEDARFWSHGGVDLHALARAATTDLVGGSRQGGSTLAEQLVKNTLLAGRPDTLANKMREALLADRLESRMGKRALLQRYLNTIYLGEGAYGVQAAAVTYFGEPASSLDPAQAALLAGLIQDPNGYNPLAHPAAARARRGTVLGLMAQHGHLSRAQLAAARSEALPTTVHLPPTGHDYYTDAVIQELMADPRLGRTPAERNHALYYGGLRIHTALDPRLQSEADGAVSSGLPDSPLHLSAAMAVVDPATGAVPAVVGGPSYSASQFDIALDPPGRQTGSAFKVFTLTAALESGFSPEDTIDGSGPCTIPDPGGTPDPWVLSNYEGESYGTVDLTTATAKSVNCAYARLALMVGLPKIAEVAHAMGVTAPLAVVPSMTLGTNDIPPLQMAAAYATLADDGVYHAPHLVTEVDRPDGSVLFRPSPAGTQVVPVQVARQVTAVLQQVVATGTGTAAGVDGRQVAGKTGTTADYADAWFVGYTPQLATAVWMGDPAAETPMTDVGGISVAGGTYPARMWSAFMTRALAPLPAATFTGPDPTQIPGGTYLALGQPRGATGYGGAVPGGGQPGPGSTTSDTVWCWSSCGRSGRPGH